MPIEDWRTDNWAGNKPRFFRHGADPSLNFPRSTKEIGWGWYRSFSSDDDGNIAPDSFLDYKVSIGAVLAFFGLIFAIGIWSPDIRDLVNSIGNLLNIWWDGWDRMPVDLTNK
jgi:hypothetical protein